VSITSKISYLHDIIRKAIFEALFSFRVSTWKKCGWSKKIICLALSENAVLYNTCKNRFQSDENLKIEHPCKKGVAMHLMGSKGRDPLCVPLNVRNAHVHHFILVWHSITTKMKWCTRALRTLSGTHSSTDITSIFETAILSAICDMHVVSHTLKWN